MNNLSPSVQVIAENQMRTNRYQPIPAGEFWFHVLDIFQVSKRFIDENMGSAISKNGRSYYPTIYSRAGIVELLQKWNNRSIPYPTKTLKLQQVLQILSKNGLGMDAIKFRHLRDSHPERVPIHFVLGGSGRIHRYLPDEVWRWLNDQKK